MSADTKTQILDAAEKLFAKQGFEATSLRAIIADAGVNLAAIHYHFRSKEGLVRAVLERRIAPINEERIRQLQACLCRRGENSTSRGNSGSLPGPVFISWVETLGGRALVDALDGSHPPPTQ
jgi:AcrR family transcriptional regulator